MAIAMITADEERDICRRGVMLAPRYPLRPDFIWRDIVDGAPENPDRSTQRACCAEFTFISKSTRVRKRLTSNHEWITARVIQDGPAEPIGLFEPTPDRNSGFCKEFMDCVIGQWIWPVDARFFGPMRFCWLSRMRPTDDARYCIEKFKPSLSDFLEGPPCYPACADCRSIDTQKPLSRVVGPGYGSAAFGWLCDDCHERRFATDAGVEMSEAR